MENVTEIIKPLSEVEEKNIYGGSSQLALVYKGGEWVWEVISS